MRFQSNQVRHYGGGGIGGFFRPLIKFFKHIIFPSVKTLGKTAIKSELGRTSVKALKKAAVNMTADALSAGGPTGFSPKEHISKAKLELADALRRTQVERIKKVTTPKRKKKKFTEKSSKRPRAANSFFD